MTRPFAGTYAQLAELLRGARVILIDFDGPVARLFAGYPAPDITDTVRQFATVHSVDLSESRTDDPLVLLRAAYRHSPEFGQDVEAQVIEHEARAATVAAPTPGAHELIRTAAASGRVVLVVSNNSERAIRTYLARHDLTDHVAHIVGRPFGHPEQMKPDPHLLRAALDIARAAGALARRAGLRDGGRSAAGASSRRPPGGLPHDGPGVELDEVGRRLHRGLPPGRRAVGLCQADGMTHDRRRGQDGANPERTAWRRPARPKTHEHERAGQTVRGATGRHGPGDRVRVRDEEVGWARGSAVAGKIGPVAVRRTPREALLLTARVGKCERRG